MMNDTPPTNPDTTAAEASRTLFANDGQRDYAVHLLRSVRREGCGMPVWDTAGIRAALVKGEQVADTLPQLLAAAFAAAADPAVKTPGWIARRGQHWPVIGGDRVTPVRAVTRMPCPDHPDRFQPCKACARERAPGPPPEWGKALAAVRARRTPKQIELDRRREAPGWTEGRTDDE